MGKNQAKLMQAAIQYDHGDAARIQHFIKVHGFASTIGTLEDLDEETQYILESTAILHDIGIHKSEEIYGPGIVKAHAKVGPAIAEQLLREVGGYTDEQIERIKYLIEHHHKYQNIDGLDYQILLEADFLVNLYEHQTEFRAIMAAQKNIFKTAAGLRLLNAMYENEFTDGE